MTARPDSGTLPADASRCSLKGHTAPVTSVVVSPDGKRLVAGSRNRTVKVWDAQTVRQILSLKEASAPVAFGHRRRVAWAVFPCAGALEFFLAWVSGICLTAAPHAGLLIGGRGLPAPLTVLGARRN